MNNFVCGMVEETKKGKNFHGAIEVLIFLALFLGSQGIIGIIVGVFVVFKMVSSGELQPGVNLEETMMSESILPMLYGTLSMIILVLIYTKFAQKRSLSSVGLGKVHAWKDYLIGYIIGVVMFSSVVFILVLTNQLTYEKATLSVLPIVLVFFLGFVIQGASEEIACRGYLMNSIAARHNLIIAVIVNASVFGILHATNPGVTFLSVLNIILFGVFASIYALKLNNIWGVCAMHSAWNFVQGNIFGLEVSGMNVEQSLWYFKANGNGLITGGSFGPEGGLVTSIVLTISIIIVLLWKTKRNLVENRIQNSLE